MKFQLLRSLAVSVLVPLSESNILLHYIKLYNMTSSTYLGTLFEHNLILFAYDIYTFQNINAPKSRAMRALFEKNSGKIKDTKNTIQFNNVTSAAH